MSRHQAAGVALAVLVVAAQGCYSTARFKGDGRVIAHGFPAELRYAIVLPPFDISQPGEHRYWFAEGPEEKFDLQIGLPLTDLAAEVRDQELPAGVKTATIAAVIYSDDGTEVARHRLQLERAGVYSCDWEPGNSSPYSYGRAFLFDYRSLASAEAASYTEVPLRTDRLYRVLVTVEQPSEIPGKAEIWLTSTRGLRAP